MAIARRGNNSPVGNSGASWQDIINNRSAGGYGQAGGGNVADMQAMYNKIKEYNESKQSEKKKEDRDANIFDYIAKGAGEASEAIRDIGEFNTRFAEETDPVKKFVNFIPTLPLGILGSAGAFAESGYEALSGRDVASLDKETGKISGEDLTPTQRGASFVNAMIEGPGAAVGGSGRLVGAGARFAGKANDSLGRAIDRILPAEGNGLIRRAAEEAGEAKPLAIGKQIGFDVFEEGGEEFVQSIAEDVRDKEGVTGGNADLGKALESFGWGALGGGLMSAAGQYANHRMDKSHARNLAAQQPQGGQDQVSGGISPMQGFDLPKAKAPFDDTLIQPAREYRSEKAFNEGREQTGGFGATVVAGRRGQGTNDMEYGLEDFKSMWNKQGKEAHDEWASRYGVDEKFIFDNVINERNLEKATARLNELHSKVGRLKMTKKRDPGTDPTHLIALDLVGYHSGSGVRMSTLASQLANGDVDGDTGFAFANKDDHGAFYPTQLLSDANSNPTKLLEYMPNMNHKTGKEKIGDAIDSNLSTVVGKSGDRRENLVSSLAMARFDEKAAERAATYLTEIRRDLKTSINPATNMVYTDAEADYAIADFLSDVMEKAGEAEVISATIGECERSVERLLGNDDHMMSGNEDTRDYVMMDGEVADLKTVADLMNKLGMNISLSRVTGDEPLRDSQAIKYMMKHRETVGSTIENSFNAYGADRVKRLLANILRLENVGEDVQNTIRDYIAMEASAKFMRELDLGTTAENRLGANIKLYDFQKSFEKAYNETIESYNNAIKADTTDETAVDMFDLVKMNRIEFDRSDSNKYNHAMGAMFKVLKDERFDGYVYIDENSHLSGKSFYEVFATTTEYGLNNSSLVGVGNVTAESTELENVISFLNDMLDVRKTESAVISNRIHKSMSECPRMSIQEALDSLGYQKSSAIMSAFVRGMSPEVMEYSGLMDWREIVSGPYAETILQGTGDDRVNLQIALTMAYKYRDVLDLVEEMNGDNDANVTKDQIAHAAAMVRDGSRISDIIAGEFADTGESRFLQLLTDTGESLEDKLYGYEGINNIAKEDRGSLIADCLRTDSSEMGLSLISQRLVKMDHESMMASKLDNGVWNEHANDFIKEVENASDQQRSSDPMRTVVDWLVDESAGHNIKFWQEFFCDAATISLKNAEKGTVPFSAMAMSQAMEQKMKGGTYSYLENVMMNNLGVMTMENFTTNRLALIDVLFFGRTIRVDKANSHDFIDAQRLCDELLGEGAVTVVNGRVDWNQFKMLIREAPTLLSNIMPEMATVAPSTQQTVVFANDDTPAKSFSDFRSKAKGRSEEMQTARERDMIRWKLSNDVSFYMSLPGLMDLSDSSRKGISEQVEKASNEYIDHIMAHAKMLRNTSSNMTDDAKAKLVEYEKNKIRAEVIKNQADDFRRQLSNALQTSDFIAMKDVEDSINVATSMTSPSTTMSLLATDYLENMLDAAVDESGMNEAEKSAVREVIRNTMDGSLTDLYSKIADGRKKAEQISIDMMSIMGTDAWLSYMADEFYSSIEDQFINNDGIKFTSEVKYSAEEISKAMAEAAYAQITESEKVAKDNFHLFDFECYDRKNLTADPNLMKDKVKRILESDEYYDPDNESYDEMSEQIDELCSTINDASKPVSERMKGINELESIRLYIVNLTLSRNLREIGSYGVESPNFNAYYDSDIFFNNFWETVEDIAFEKDDEGNWKYKLAKAKDVSKLGELKPRYANARNSYMATNAAYHICTGRIGYGVGSNGALLNTSPGLAAMPHDIECGDEGRVVRVGDLESEGLVNSGHTIEMDINGEKVRRKLNSTFDIRSVDPDTEIRVYDGVCRNPFCHLHSATIGAPGFEDSVDTLYLYSTILDTSQEAANLKLKKSLRDLKHIASPRQRDPEVKPPVVKPLKTDTREEIGKRTHDAILEFRKDIKRYVRPSNDTNIPGAFENDLGGSFITISDEEAEMIAKVCAYTAEVKYTDTEGNKRTSIITLDEIMEPGGTFTLPPDITYTEIESVTPFYTPYEKLNKKAIHDVANDRFNPDPGNKRTVDTQIMKSTLERSSKDWSRYDAGNIDIGSALKATPAKRFAFPTQFIPMDSMSSRQRLLEETGRSDRTVSSMISGRVNNNISLKENKVLVDKSNSLTGNALIGNNAVVTNVSFAKGFIDSDTANRSIYRDLIDYRDQYLRVHNRPDEFAVEGKAAAYMFIGTKNDVDDLFSNQNGAAFKYDYIITNERPSNQNVEKQFSIGRNTYYVVKTRWQRDKAWAKNSTYEYPLVEVSIDDYAVAYFDDEMHGFLLNPDSGGFATEEFFEHNFKKIQDDDYVTKIKWDRPFKGEFSSCTQLVNSSEYSKIMKSIEANDGRYELHVNGYKDSVDPHNVMQYSMEFMRSATNNNRILNATGQWLDGTVEIGRVFALVKRKDSMGVTHIAPIMFEGNQAKRVSNVTGIDVSGDNVIVNKHSVVEIGPDDSVKGFIEWEAYKGMLSVVDEGRKDILPKLSGIDETFNKYIYYDGKSREKRLSTKGKMVWCLNCWEYSRMRNTSLRAGNNKSKKLSNWAIKEDKGKKNIDWLFDDHGLNDPRWKYIADGKETLFIDIPNNKVLNRAIRKLAHSSVYGNQFPLSILFESHEFDRTKGNGTWGGFKPRDCDEIFGFLNILNFNEIKAVFNAMDPAITSDPEDRFISRDDPGTLVRDDGCLNWIFVKGKRGYGPGRILRPNLTDDATNVGQGLGSAVMGKQTVNKIGLLHGIREADEQNFLDAIMSLAGENVVFGKSDINKVQQRVVKDMNLHPGAAENIDIDSINGKWGNLSSRKLKANSILENENTYNRIGMRVVRKIDGSPEPVNLMSDTEYRKIKKTFEDAFEIQHLTDIEFLNEVKKCTSWSLQAGKGNLDVDIAHIREAVDTMMSRKNNDQFHIEGGLYGRGNDRVSTPLGPKGVDYNFYSKSKYYQRKYKDRGGFKGYVEDAVKELNVSIKALEDIKYVDGHVIGLKQEEKKLAIMNMIMYSQLTHGMEIDTNQLYAGGFTIQDMFDMDDKMQRMLLTDEEIEYLDKAKEQIEAQREYVKRMERNSRDKRLIRIDNKNAAAGFSTLVKGSDATMTSKILGRMESGIRLCAVSNPVLIVPNTMEAFGHSLIAKIGMGLPVGPYNQENILKPGLASQVAKNEKAFKLFKIINLAQLLNVNEELIMGLEDANGDFDEFIDSVYAGRGPLGKVSDFVFRLTSGADLSERWQFEIFLQRMGQLVVADGIATETMPMETVEGDDGKPRKVSAMELNLTNNPAGWMIKCMMRDNPAHNTFLRALNFSTGPAMARDTCVSILADELFKNHKFVSFFNTCFGSTFYRYTSNFTGRILNWVMPISSMNYVLIEKMNGIPRFEQMGIERAQVHANLKAAVLSDAMHLSIPTLAILIATGLGAALQPPEDEDKANDYREYTFFGMRIAEEWWIADILGPALPMACFWKSIIDGKPRLDVLIEGMGTVLASNPLMKIGDVVEIITNQDALMDDIAEEKERYSNAFGGAPTDVEQWLARGGSYFLTCFGRMITPSILREWQNNTLKYEKSYRKIYAPGVEGVDAEAGQTGDTVNTTYEDAMLRKVTRNNPMLGLICDIMFHPSTSYTAGGTWIQGMPNVVYDDVYQRQSMKEYSIYQVDENGNYVEDENGKWVEKSDQEKDQVAFNVIATLESTDDMDALYKSGFMIDSQTRAYVSDVIWEIVKDKQDQFNEIANSKEFSAYSLGNGDYWAGRELRNEMFQAYYNDINYLKYTLYRDKLWSYEMRKGVQHYIKENVTYRQDANGEWYTSGTPKTDLNPTGFAVSPGRTDSLFTSADDEGTMGWGEDWATPSKVTGLSMYDRSLIALKAENEEVPDFDSWGEKRGLDEGGSGSGSKSSSSSSGSSDKPSVTNNPYDIQQMNGGGSGYGSRRSGGGRRRGGGGGGGGGGRPSIYSRVSTPNMSNPKQSSSGNLRDTNFDYLRPNFETKGSRESNKRGDF